MSTPNAVKPTGVTTFESPAGEQVIVRATGNETGGHYDILELLIDPGPGVTPLHIHHENDEAMLVLDGELTVQLGDDRFILNQGSYVNAPKGEPHTYRNSGDVPARVLFINAPGNNWEYLREASKHGPVEDESDLERMLPILESYGVEMVGPPLTGD